jgi:hypothetical protein
MTPHDIIRSVLERVMDIHDAHDAADEILELLAAQGFVVVHASAVINVQKPCKCGSATDA